MFVKQNMKRKEAISATDKPHHVTPIIWKFLSGTAWKPNVTLCKYCVTNKGL